MDSIRECVSDVVQLLDGSNYDLTFPQNKCMRPFLALWMMSRQLMVASPVAPSLRVSE